MDSFLQQQLSVVDKQFSTVLQQQTRKLAACNIAADYFKQQHGKELKGHVQLSIDLVYPLGKK